LIDSKETLRPFGNGWNTSLAVFSNEKFNQIKQSKKKEKRFDSEIRQPEAQRPNMGPKDHEKYGPVTAEDSHA
jgi:hypothetical protein